mgnify:CR=1 FL=1
MSTPVGSSQWMYSSGAGSFYPYSIDQSLRFNDGDSPRLSLDPIGSPTLTTKCTISFWVKRGQLTTTQYVFTGEQSNVYYDVIYISNADKLAIVGQENASSYGYQTSALFRDVGAWYHVVLECDSTLATGTDRYKLYVNGVQQTLTSIYGVHPQNHAWYWNKSGNSQNIGRSENYGASFDGYLAEVNFIDGTALDPTSFGETINGIWVPKSYSGSYGTNGFYLSYADSAAIGDDLSGNTNDFTATNLAASDVVPDSPTNNFATMNELQVQGVSQTAPYALSEGSLKMTSTAGAYAQMSGAMGVQSGKWYTETYINSAGYPSWYIGWIARDRLTTFTGSADFEGVTTGLGYFTGSNVYILDFGETNNVTTQVAYSGLWSGARAPTTGDIIGCAVDFDDRKVWWSINGEWVDVGSGAGDPANGTNPTSTYTASDVADDAYKFAWQLGYGSTTKTINFGQDSTFAGAITAGGNADENGYGDFKYAVPSGFLAVCSANLPEVTIGPNSDEQADNYFNTVLYTGTGASNSITGVGFQPDWTWIKGRSNADYNYLVDSVRGYTERLFSNLTDGASVEANTVASSDSDGFTLGTDAGVNRSSSTYVAWNWKAGGTAVSNTDGSTTSSVSANTDAGFSILTYTADAATGTVGHGLDSAPELVIAKPRNASGTNWYVMQTDALSANQVLNLDNTSAAFNPGENHFNDTYPTSTVVSYGGYMGNTLTGDDKLMYCFHSVDGFSKVGSYVGNGNADGTFVYTGFRPAFVLLKKSSAAGDNWSMYDNKRDTDNTVREYIIPNQSAAAASTDTMDFVSNGFKVRNSGAYINTSGATYIYLAFAEAPFKYANAR